MFFFMNNLPWDKENSCPGGSWADAIHSLSSQHRLVDLWMSNQMQPERVFHAGKLTITLFWQILLRRRKAFYEHIVPVCPYPNRS